MTQDEEMPFIRARPTASTSAHILHSDGDENVPEESPSSEPNFEFLWEEYQKRMEAQREWEENGVDIHPDYGFVAKTRESKSKKKVFINIVSSPMLSAPIEEPNPEEPSQTRVRIPMSCEGPFPDVDKDGADCSVFDVVFNPECLTKCNEDPAFKEFVIGVSVENIRQKCKLDLDNTFSFPKMKYKGAGPPRMQHIKKSGILKKSLVELVDDDEDERKEKEREALKSEFKLNFDQMYNKRPAGASAKSVMPSVASLLAKKSEPALSQARQATVQPAQPAQSAPTKPASVAKPAPPSSLPSVASHTTTPAPPAPPVQSAPAAPCVANTSESAWMQDGVACQLQCPSLRSHAELIAFDSSHWDDEIWPESLSLSLHLPSVSRITEIDLDISSDDVLVTSSELAAVSDVNLRIQLPFSVDEVQCSAKFDKKRQVLLLSMPCVGKLCAESVRAYTVAVSRRSQSDSITVQSTDAPEVALLRQVQATFGTSFTSPLAFRLV